MINMASCYRFYYSYEPDTKVKSELNSDLPFQFKNAILYKIDTLEKETNKTGTKCK